MRLTSVLDGETVDPTPLKLITKEIIYGQKHPHSTPIKQITDATTDRPRKRAVSYLRVSSSGQVNTDYDPEGISLPAQREAVARRADQLDADIIDEYVEPGRTATTTDGRPEFQRMMARIKAEKDIDYIIVYARSRLHRNTVDAAITKGDLRKAGVILISVMDYTEDSAIGDLVATVLDGVNEYQSRAAGADISYKMGQKVKRGGTVGKAPIGYINIREMFEGREVRTVALDPERAPLVRMAFELYATGSYGFHGIIDLLTNAGLRTRPSKKNPSGTPLSIHKLGLILRDRYYLGYVTHQGVEYPGRHEPLISREIFDRVQAMLDTRRAGGVRERNHNHYLKGTVWCHRCQRRLIINRAKNKQGILYFYYLCPGRRDETCDLPHLPVQQVEDAVVHHYGTIHIPAPLQTQIRETINTAHEAQHEATRTLREQIKTKITKLDRQEDGYLDLIGDPDWPKEKITPRLRQVRDDRERLQRQLAATDNPQINAGREAIEILLDLLNDPREIYRLASKRARKVLNQAFFVRMFVDMDPGGPYIATDEITETVKNLHTLETPAPSSRGLTNDHLVEVLTRNLNYAENTKSVQMVLEKVAQGDRTDEPNVCESASGGGAQRIHRRLTLEQTNSLLNDRRSGVTLAELAGRYKISASSVKRILREHGVRLLTWR